MVAPAFDYSDLVATADELLQEFGRQVTFIRTATTPTDATKPWRGEVVMDDTTLTGVWAAIVPFMSEDDKDSVRYGIKMVIVSGSSFPSNDAETFDRLVDADGGSWHLHDCDIVDPGGTRVLYTFKAEA